jgi:multiple sugar transport system permease protein
MRRRWPVRVVDLVILAIVTIVSLYPVAWLLSISLQPPNAAYQLPTSFVFVPTTENYGRLLGDSIFLGSIVASISIAVPATVLCTIAGAMAGYAFSRHAFRGSRVLAGVLLVGRLLPAFAVVIPTFLMFRSASLLDTELGLIFALAAMQLPIAILIMYRIFDQIPVALDEVALIDGASRSQILIRILAPLAIPGLAASAVVTFVLIWNEFLFVLVLAGHRIITLPVSIARFETQRQILWGPISAASIIAILPVLVVVLIAQRQLLSGLGVGATRE